MAIYTVSTKEKKNVEEREQWTNQEKGWNIVRINGYRWGTFTVETLDDEPPEDIDPANPEGINMYDYFSDNAENGAELESMDDGWYMDWVWDDAMSEDDLLLGVVHAAQVGGWLVHHDRRSDLAIQQGMAGFPDVIAIHPERAELLVLELKSEHGRLTPLQAAWLDAFASVGITTRVINYL